MSQTCAPLIPCLIYITCRQGGADDLSLPQLTPAEVARYDNFWGRLKSNDSLPSSFPEPLRVPDPSASLATVPAVLDSQALAAEPMVPSPTTFSAEAFPPVEPDPASLPGQAMQSAACLAPMVPAPTSSAAGAVQSHTGLALAVPTFTGLSGEAMQSDACPALVVPAPTSSPDGAVQSPTSLAPAMPTPTSSLGEAVQSPVGLAPLLPAPTSSTGEAWQSHTALAPAVPSPTTSPSSEGFSGVPTPTSSPSSQPVFQNLETQPSLIVVPESVPDPLPMCPAKRQPSPDRQVEELVYVQGVPVPFPSPARSRSPCGHAWPSCKPLASTPQATAGPAVASTTQASVKQLQASHRQVCRRPPHAQLQALPPGQPSVAQATVASQPWQASRCKQLQASHRRPQQLQARQASQRPRQASRKPLLAKLQRQGQTRQTQMCSQSRMLRLGSQSQLDSVLAQLLPLANEPSAAHVFAAHAGASDQPDRATATCPGGQRCHRAASSNKPPPARAPPPPPPRDSGAIASQAAPPPARCNSASHPAEWKSFQRFCENAATTKELKAVWQWPAQWFPL